MLYFGDKDDKHPGMSNWTSQIQKIIPYCGGVGIDVGAGGRTLYPTTITVDHFFGHTLLADGHYLPFKPKSADFVFSCHCLEHLDNPLTALNEWVRVSRKWTIVLLPDVRYIDRIGSGGEDPEHKIDFTIQSVFKLIQKVRAAEIWEIGFTLWRSSIYFVLLKNGYRPDIDQWYSEV